MIENFSEHIQSILKTIPETPGVYRYYDKDNNLLYVGKAKNSKETCKFVFC